MPLTSLWLSTLESALDRVAGLGELRAERRGTGLPPHLRTGQRGERAAFFYLRRRGWAVVARNWRTGLAPGDLDLVAWDGPVLCFVEVKTRTATEPGAEVATAEASVDRDKRRSLRRLARIYLRRVPPPEPPLAEHEVRFDIVTVHLKGAARSEFEHFRGAFDWSEPHRAWRTY